MRPMKRDTLILTAGPSITEREENYVLDAVRNGWNTHWGDYLQRFEKAFADYVGVRHAMATSSCTGALHLTLAALGVGPGDEVIVPEITWIATAAAVNYVGAKPVMVDIETDTWCIDPRSVEATINGRTRAIIPVHLYGHPADMDPISALAERHGLFVVEDAAPSLGAMYHGKRTGSLGRAAAFSFQGAKIMVTGEGGMFVTDDTALYERVKKLGDHGRSLTRPLWNDEIGFKYKMSNLQAALGLAQLERIEELVAKKRQIFEWYRTGLEGLPLTLNAERPGCRNICWMTTLILDDAVAIERDALIRQLREWNVDSRPVFAPMSEMPMFEKRDNPIAARIGARGINLPSGHTLTRDDIEYICAVIRAELSGA